MRKAGEAATSDKAPLDLGSTAGARYGHPVIAPGVEGRGAAQRKRGGSSVSMNDRYMRRPRPVHGLSIRVRPPSSARLAYRFSALINVDQARECEQGSHLAPARYLCDYGIEAWRAA